jgi:hypothetical protein
MGMSATAILAKKAVIAERFQHCKYALTDETNLARMFDRIERWRNVRAVLQVLNFGASLWATVVLAGSP